MTEEYRREIIRLAEECNDEDTLKRVYTILLLNRRRAGDNSGNGE